MNLPSREQARSFLLEARFLNPGPWISHSIFVARAAEAIAQRHPQLDPEKAFILGQLHDIGRRCGVTGARHILDGYNFLHDLGHDPPARVCITHSYPIRDIDTIVGNWDCTPSETDFLKDYLAAVEFDDYDRLIQLCDCLALPSGFCLVEKRLIDVALRYGVNQYSVPRWEKYLAILQDFERALGCSIYSLLPGVVENTFASLNSS